MPQNNQNKILERRLTTLEVGLKELQNDVRSIKDNHLEKIYNKLDAIEKEYYKRPGWAIAGLCSLVVGLILYILSNL